MEPSPLLKLPPELRNSIWEYAMHEQHPITLSRTHSTEAPLLRVCKKIRNEAGLLFYAINDFDAITNMYDWQHVAHWLHHGPPEKRSLLKSFTLRVEMPRFSSAWPIPSQRAVNVNPARSIRPPKGTLPGGLHGIDFGGRETASVVRISVNGGNDTERMYKGRLPPRTSYLARLLLMYISYGLEVLDAMISETTAEGQRVEYSKVDDRLEEVMRKRA